MTKLHCQERPSSLPVLTRISGAGGNTESHPGPSQAAAAHFLCKHKMLSYIHVLHGSFGLVMLCGKTLPQLVTQGFVMG